ncbi:hypothetical protein SPBR_05315 [Sporothrix brasiliensis 5110]|uniref:Uncharacterized protein n=1 Tax=Sporothrix brasiliensis 5110 TaxID=1398154 RepID=A0A0C2EMX3_9PEZI|nr:uncharacterized protein SPBR_05315 [Sporothrix brasiliensis 5110]KIH87474.1 hypothetical protein SPBR_05315 [Sporothrix brasiliensis 5110]
MAIAAVITCTSSTKRKASADASDGDTERRKRRVWSANKPNSTSDGLLTPAVCDFNALSLGSPMPISGNGALAPVAQMDVNCQFDYPFTFDCPIRSRFKADALVGNHNGTDFIVHRNVCLGSPVPFSGNAALAPVAQMELYYPLPIDCPGQSYLTADASEGHHDDSDLFVPQNDDCLVIDVGDDGYKLPPDLERELFGPPVEELLRMDAEAAASSRPVQL